MSTQTALPRPDFGRLYGVTHDPATKQEIVRAPRVLKIGIGVPKGRAVSVFMHDGAWMIRFGVWEKTSSKDKLVMKTVYRGNSVVKDKDGNSTTLSNKREDVEKWYHAHKQDAAVSNRPQKLPFFTFSTRLVREDEGGRPVEVFEPDFEAIEDHGDAPRRIPVIITTMNPLKQEDQMWSASELKCHGDGLLADRVLSMGSDKDEYWKQAKESGLKMFPYSPCRLGGCAYSGVECKKHSVLEIQLAHSLRLGATAYFASTGSVSADRLAASLKSIQLPLANMGYSVVGAPMFLVLGSFRANFQGKPSIQPCVWLELTANGSKALNRLLAENAWQPVKIGESPKMISGPEDETYEVPSNASAAAIHAEFSEAEDAEFDDEDGPGQADPPTPAATATQAKTDKVAEGIRKAREKQEAAPTVPQEPDKAAPEPVKFPWSDRAGMNSAFTSQKNRIGEAKFGEILTQAGVLIGSLKHDDAKAVEVYGAMVAAQIGTPVVPLDSDVF